MDGEDFDIDLLDIKGHLTRLWGHSRTVSNVAEASDRLIRRAEKLVEGFEKSREWAEHQNMLEDHMDISVEDYSTVSQRESNDANCTICLEPLEPRTTSTARPWASHAPVKTRCGHVFGKHCLGRWLRDQDKRKCPVCRREVIPAFPKFNPYRRYLDRVILRGGRNYLTDETIALRAVSSITDEQWLAFAAEMACKTVVSDKGVRELLLDSRKRLLLGLRKLEGKVQWKKIPVGLGESLAEYGFEYKSGLVPNDLAVLHDENWAMFQDILGLLAIASGETWREEDWRDCEDSDEEGEFSDAVSYRYEEEDGESAEESEHEEAPSMSRTARLVSNHEIVARAESPEYNPVWAPWDLGRSTISMGAVNAAVTMLISYSRVPGWVRVYSQAVREECEKAAEELLLQFGELDGELG